MKRHACASITDIKQIARASAVSEEEWNFLLNPEHQDFAKIALGTPRILSMDPRVP
jgi:hypothetical protein